MKISFMCTVAVVFGLDQTWVLHEFFAYAFGLVLCVMCYLLFIVMVFVSSAIGCLERLVTKRYVTIVC